MEPNRQTEEQTVQISVILPAYNCAATLEKSAESVLHSGLRDFELLLIDDGSTDATPALCDRLAAGDDRIRCIHQPNGGVSAARNRGLLAASGVYVLFFDADDTVDAGSLAHAAALLGETGPDMLLFGMSFDYYYKGRRYRRDELVCPREGLLDRAGWKREFRALYDCNALTSACNKFFRRTLLMQNGVRFNPNLHIMEDFLFVLDALQYCGTVFCLPEAIYRYRQPEDEKRAYLRLQRVASLTRYMQPFEESMQRLGLSGTGEAVLQSMYLMLLQGKLRWAGVRAIEAEAGDFLQSHYASDVLVQGRQNPNWHFAELLAGGHASSIRFLNLKSQLRHGAAVCVKAALAACRAAKEQNDGRA